MFRVERFLTIFELETGGQFVGYFGIITSSILLLISMLMLTKIFTEWDLIEETLHTMRIERDMNLQDPASMEMFKHSLIAALVSFILLNLISIMAFVLLVRGTRTHLARQVKPSVILFAMLTVLSLFALFARLTPSTIVNFVFDFYIFVVLFSLWKKYQDGFQGRGAHHIIITHNPNFIPIAFQEKA